jgi:glycosyltransferase involved in cell wall biosynthesis
MTGEKRIGPNEFPDFANTTFRIVFQPGLSREISKTEPDVLIADGFFQWTIFALLYKILHRTPLVICYERTFHTERNVQWYRTAYRKLVLKFIDAITCNGKLCSEYTQWLGMPESRITYGHMVAETENLKREVSFVSNSETEALKKMWGAHGLVFLAVGKLIKRKGCSELIYGWSLVEKVAQGEATLVFAGSGAEEDSLKSLAQSLGLSCVVFLGPVDYNDIAKHYAAADVFVMPTLEDNWSLVVPEAMACGLPILCSKYNGCYPELIAPGENGWVFDPLDKEDTFEALQKCLQNKPKLKQMGRRSMEIVSRYTPKHAANAILDACKIALTNKRKSAHTHRP